MATNTTLSNLYVEKASSEHPLALWMLNEKVDYISQITEDERQFHLFATWQLTNAEATLEPEGSFNAPFSDSAVSKIIGAVPPTETQDIIATSVYNLSENLVPELYNFNIGFYAYFDTALANSVTLGYIYTDSLTSETVEVTETFLVKQTDRESWRFFSGTFGLPPSSADNVRLIIKINVRQGGLAGDYDVYINGLSLGQWSEDFNKESYGIDTDPLPANINLPSIMTGVPAFPYGASGNSGYYLGQGYQLFCKNFGVPLVFGSSNVSKVSSNVYNGVNYPSLIFPGYGFLNERGRYNDYTVELWLRINASSSIPRKIFGPIIGSDGLYADGAHLTFKVGNFIGSHFVGEWFRPMLVHIRELKNSITVILNGEEVINFEIDQDLLDLPAEFVDGKSQDWLGLYAYADIDPVDIDNFSIYSYGIPTEVTKRRWVWGQAVSSPEQTNSSINSITAFNDYAFANYASNYNYPDFANWNQAFFSNVEAESKTLRLPDYQLPVFELGGNTTKQLYDDIQAMTSISNDDNVAGRKYLTLKPNSEWESDSDFVYFDKLGMLNDQLQTFYGVFKTDGTEQDKPLIKVTNKLNNDYFLILLDETSVRYSINLSGVTATIATKTVEADKKFAVGINIPAFIADRDTTISRFFSDSSTLDVFVAGDGSVKFNGNVYKVGFDSSFNTRKISELYDLDGIFKTSLNAEISSASTSEEETVITTTDNHPYIVGDKIRIFTPEYDTGEKLITETTANTLTIASVIDPLDISEGSITDDANRIFYHTANYTLTAIDKYGILFPDIAVAGYWEDYMPLSYFAKEVVDSDGNKNFELDSIQFNQQFPEPPASLSTEQTSPWSYEDLKIEYSVPNILTYENLNNDFYTGWENYEDMSNNTVRTSFYETGSSVLRSFVSFQNIVSGANNSLLDFKNYYKPLTSGLVDPAAIDLDWENTAYEVTTGTIIYPPAKTQAGRRVDFNDYALVYHLDFRSDGILHHPVTLRELQLASHVLERTDFTPVGSRFGIPVFYYSRSGLYFDLKAKNPIATYKKSTPYLYLNRQSGWKIRGEFSDTTDRGLVIPVNLPQADETEVSSLQLWIRFSEKEFPADPIMIFSIDHNDGIYDFYIQADSSGQRGFVFGVDRESSEILFDLNYYVNGQSVDKPFLVNEEWVVLGIEFPDLLDFSNRTGRVSLNGPLTYNNVSYNLATNIEKDENLETRSWVDMLSLNVGGITDVSATGSEITYTTTGEFTVGETVSIVDVVPSQFNIANAVVVSATDGSFTIAGSATGPYVSGGVATSGTWIDLQDKLPVDQDTVPPYTWQSVKVISQSRIFNINPKAIYEKYTGSDRIVIDDESSGILIDPDRLRMYKELSWSTNTKIPA
jgi:hypothetical protein